MLFLPAFEMQPQQKVCGSLNVQGGITKLCRKSGNRSQLCDECLVLKENLSPVFYGSSEILEKVVINNMSAQNHCNMRLQFVKGGVGDLERTGYWQRQVPHFAPGGEAVPSIPWRWGHVDLFKAGSGHLLCFGLLGVVYTFC